VVTLIGVAIEEAKVSIVMELMGRGSLSGLLRSKTELPWDLRLSMARDIAMGIQVLHTNQPRVVHRDLKSANILLDENFRCKISDFGLAVVKQDSATKTGSLAGTLGWIAPELFALRPKFTTKSDIYAFAVILWEVMTRLIPYEGAHPAVVQASVLRGQREEFTAEGPEGYQELVQQCWHQDPSLRPEVEEILAALENLDPTKISPVKTAPPNFSVLTYSDDTVSLAPR